MNPKGKDSPEAGEPDRYLKQSFVLTQGVAHGQAVNMRGFSFDVFLAPARFRACGVREAEGVITKQLQPLQRAHHPENALT